MKPIATEKSQQNRAALDPWTAVHFSSGLALGLMEVPLVPALGLSLVYEAAEQVLERRDVGKDLFETSGPESLSNALVDVLVMVAGHRLGRLWNSTGR